MKVIKKEVLDLDFPEEYWGNIIHTNEGSVYVSDIGLVVHVSLDIVHQAEIVVGKLDELIDNLVEELQDEHTTETG